MYPLVLSICFRSLRFFSVILLLFGAVKKGYGQRVYADAQRNGTTSSLGNSATVTQPLLSVNSNLSDFTTLTASSTVGTATAWQQLIFPNTLVANSIVYLKFASTNALLGGGVAVQAYANSTSGSDGSVVATQSSTFTSIDGITYLAVTSSSPFNAVRLTLSSPAALGTATANIYYAFFETPHTNCAEVIGTSVGGSGISLGGGVSSPLTAVDNNLTTFSTISGGILGVGHTITQSAHFSNLSNLGDAATITFSVPPALLQLGLFNNVVINTYKGFGTTPVSSTSLSSLISLDLLGILSSGDRYTVSTVPNGQFDRIEVSVATGVSLLSNFRLHEIQRTPAKPTVPTAYPDAIEVCEGETVSITATSPSAGSILRWYDAVNDGTLLQESNGNSDTYTTSSLPYISPTDTTFIYVASSWESGCPAESERTKIAIVVHPKPIVDPISGQDDICVNEYVTFTSATAGGTWSSADNTVAVVDPLSGAVAGIGAGTVIIRYTLSDAQTSCSNYQEKPITVHPKPGKPDLSVSGND